MMSFGLKNVGETYKWLVNKVFVALIAKRMEVVVSGTPIMCKTWRKPLGYDDIIA